MNRRLLNILLIAFVIAAGCSYIVFRLIGSRIAGPRVTTTRVVAAAADVKLGSVLRNTDLTTVEIVGTLPKGAILKPENAVGRGVISSLYVGEPVLENRLAPAGSGGGLASTIPPGMRAAAVRVNEVVGVAGFVTPGMHVDILISGNPPGENNSQGPRVKTLLQNIEVLSAGTDIQRDAEGKPQQVQVVNLLVTPDQAEALSLASNETHIQLVLRNPMDNVVAKPNGTAVAELFSNGPAPKSAPVSHTPSAKPAPSSHSYLVEVFNGSKRSETKFASGEEPPK
ncbi:MAG: Flp pilus assembly protein CpaB [Edaphobacter sp.]